MSTLHVIISVVVAFFAGAGAGAWAWGKYKSKAAAEAVKLAAKL